METKKCPKCFTDIPSKATKCPNCQSDIRSKRTSKIIWGLFLFSILSIIIFASSTEQSDTNYAVEANPVEWAGTYAQVYVTNSLKAPSTAKFGLITNNNITKLDNNDYRVSSYVDSQNGFGAMIRSNWEVLLNYKGGDAKNAGNWEAKKIVIDGKIVFGE